MNLQHLSRLCEHLWEQFSGCKLEEEEEVVCVCVCVCVCVLGGGGVEGVEGPTMDED